MAEPRLRHLKLAGRPCGPALSREAASVSGQPAEALEANSSAPTIGVRLRWRLRSAEFYVEPDDKNARNQTEQMALEGNLASQRQNTPN